MKPDVEKKPAESFRLSPQQTHLWLQHGDNCLPYRALCTVLIEGHLHTQALKTALIRVIDRHEILRTTFQCPPGMRVPLQVITASRVVWDSDVDLSDVGPEDQAAKLEVLWREASRLPVDLAGGPLLHISRVTLSPAKHMLLVNLPALCADPTSLKNLVHDLSRAYAACLREEELADQPMQYADLAEWQNQLLEAEDTRTGREYWRKEGIAAWLGVRLPFEVRSPAEAGFAPEALTVALQPKIRSQLAAFVRHYNTSASLVFLACWQVLLWRLTGQADGLVGVACDGRRHAELEGALGLLAKYVPLRCRLVEDLPFRDFLQQVHTATHEVRRWQEYFSWESLAGSIRDGEGPLFFPFSFDFAEQPVQHAAGGVTFAIHRQAVCLDRFKVKLACVQRGDELSAEWHYDACLFHREDIERLAEQFVALLASALRTPDAGLGVLELLSSREREQLVIAFNDTQTDYPHDRCLHHLFEAQVDRTPHRVAVVFEGQQLTYAELNARANQLAHYLQTRGIGPDVPVALCLERGVEIVIGLLGILKAGGAYVPLDPRLPKERLAFMVEETEARVVVTQQRLVADLPENRASVLCLDADWNAIAQERDDNPSSGVTARHLVYVMFTSGSTGKPKGVALAHRSLVNYVSSISERLELPAGASFATVSSFATDLGNTAIFSALCSGGCLHIISPERAADSTALGEYFRHHVIDCLKITPSHLTALLASPDPGQILPRKRLVLGGEACRWGLLDKLRELAPACHIFNHYGPTEAAVGVLTHQVDSGTPTGLSATVPLGRPLGNTQIYVLNSHLQPVSRWTPGELYIGGVGLARGYLSRPDLTAEKFIPDPFSTAPGARLYKTGDLVRFLADGSLEFLGRKDDQVKIHGFRVELGEIEAVLGEHPAVRQAVALAREDGAGDKRLVAYVVPKAESTPTGSELRSFLRAKLPEHMVPAAFVMLDALPLTANGKVDRRVLPALDPARLDRENTFVAPRTPVEETLAEIWTQVLGAERVGVSDNFFELGGHSLLAIQVVSRLRHAFQVELPLRDLFETPTVAGLARRVEAAHQVKQGLTVPPISPVPHEGALPLSYAQQRLWFLDQLEPGNTAYNNPIAVRLTGPLNVAAGEQALNEVVRRHEALRTTFVAVDGQPVQVIAPPLTLPLPVIDLRALPADAREAEGTRLAIEEVQRPFDLAQGPPLRALLLRLGDEEHIAVLTLHHIVSDGWSMGVLIRELGVLYAAFSAGQPSPLPELSIQYADFALWQRQWLQGEVLESQRAYWQGHLAGLPLLELPTDRPRPALQTFRGATFPFVVPASLVSALRQLGQREGATLFMTLLAAFQALLARYSGQEDIAVGTPIANRTRAETEDLIGVFVNTLVLRTDLQGNPPFREVLGRVREVCLGAYAHQDLPFEQLVGELQPVRDLSRMPLVQVLFALQNAPLAPVELEGLTVSPLAGERGRVRVDLECHIGENGGELRGGLVYSTDLFAEGTIGRLVGHWQTLLEAVVARPEQRLSELPLLTAAERQQVLIEWNNTKSDYPQARCIHQLFEAQAERTPEAVAVVCEDQRLTYRELNRRANQLAHYLQARGVGPEVLVGLCLERSLEMVIGLLGILKAGGAYVPLDPAYPKDRLAFMLADAQVPVLLTQHRLVAGLPEQAAQVVCLDADWERIGQESGENPGSAALADNLAYVLYTSGSTGQPKGVEIQHAGLVNLVIWHQRAYDVTPADRATQLAGLSFDASGWELWPYLTAGASIYIADEETRLSPAKLLDWLAAKAITICFLPTPLAETVLEEQGLTDLTLRVLLTGGDKLHRAPRQALSFGLVNNYGPTENTVVTTWAFVPTGTGAEVPPPIGRPIANTQVYLLDQNLQPVPIGVPGELYIGGDGLARGYLHRPDLTAERFIPHPFSPEPGARLYKTGDLARYLPDGNIEFLGRRDQQVKVRGFRIELGEIEVVLSQHPAVREVAVLARDDAPGEKRLVAYVVPGQGQGLSLSELRSFLRTKLPDYMVPAALVVLDALPLTPSGKVDRRALPPPGHGWPQWEGAYVAPRTPAEEVVATIWAQVLGLEQIGVEDNFFELGGHSLLATQVLSRLRTAFHTELPLRALFEAPTVAGLAQHIEAANREAQGLQAPPLVPVARAGALPLSFAQQRLWFLDQLVPDNPFYNIPAAVRLHGPLQVAALEQSLNEVVRRHEALRTTFAAVDGQPVQVIAPTLTIAVPVVELRELPEAEQEAEVQRLAAEESLRPFDLARGPLLRVQLLRPGEEEHVALLTLHHIISDAWSMEVLIRELAVLYEAFAQGQPSPLPELPIQYADFALWQRQWLQGEVLEAQRAYWQTQLRDVPVLELPTDYPRPALQSFRGATCPFALSASLTDALKALSRREGVTLFMTLLAAFEALLARYSGQEDIVVGTPITNRTRLETEGLIGFFLNTLVLRTDLSGDPSFRELVRRVREVCLGAYAHQDLPFEQLVEELQPVRDLSRPPLFQVLFVLQHVRENAVQLPGLRLSPVEVEGGIAKFDLTLFLWEGAEGLAGGLEYNTDLFEAATISRLAEHFQVLLESIVAQPEQHLLELPLLPAAERHRLLVEWNATTTPYPHNQCIQQLFEAQVERTPEALAVVFAQERVTYGELNRRANQLAHYLRALGVGPEVLVGLCLERSVEMVVGLLGILKAGGAYVPLDPAYPRERLAFLLADAQVPVLLTQQRLLEQLPATPAHLVCLDTDWALIAQQREETPSSSVTPDNLAYVLYTSGSTGSPKGVAMSHRPLCNLLAWQGQSSPLAPQARVLQFASLSFDVSFQELFSTWGAGATVVLLAEDLRADAERVWGFLTEESIERLFLPFVALHHLAQAAGGQERVPPTLREIITAGEQLQVGQPLAKFFEKLPGCTLQNQYGPTESHVVTAFSLPCVVREWPPLPPIGRPIANVELYVVDRHLNPVPVGVAGEIYIGGVGLARGYLHRPELTAERFIPHPFSPEPGARLYKTGDLARYLPDGNIEFLGRLDQQVKLRGFRIEPGEIEAVLSHHPAVREAVVVAREDVPGEKRLVAYVVCPPDQTLTLSELRSFLQAKLPDYMVPAAFVRLPALPLTPSGKVDRRALPAPNQIRPELEKAFVAPRTPVEETLVGIWAQVLGVERVGVYDSFFELGGHSLLATQLISRVRTAFQVEIPLRRLFEVPTVAGLAESIEIARRTEQGLQAPPLVPVPWEGDKRANAEQVLVRLDQLSEEEVDSLLSDILAEEELKQ